MNRRVIGKKYVSWSMARKILEDRIKQESGSIIAEQERTWEYLKAYGDRDPELESKAIKKLIDLGLDEVLAVNLVNICPEEPGEVRLVLAMRKELKYDEELVSKILDVINECRSS